MIDAGAGRRVGRPPLTDQTALLAAARSIGFAGLTVGRVTASAGVKYSTFYRHFPKLDALITALVDQICAELTPPDPERAWQDVVRDTCTSVRKMFEQHPGMAEAITALPRLPAGVLAHYTGLTDTLTAAGFAEEAAAAGATCAIETVTVTRLSARALQYALPDPQRLDDSTSTDNTSTTALRAARELIGRPNGAWTDRKIDLLINGLEADLVSGRASPELRGSRTARRRHTPT